MLPHALDPPVGQEDDGLVGEHDKDQEHAVQPARPPLTEARARESWAARWATDGSTSVNGRTLRSLSVPGRGVTSGEQADILGDAVNPRAPSRTGQSCSWRATCSVARWRTQRCMCW
ncbi:hypothetical protein ACF053_00465 [Streptomyces kanasensis]|uniref:hypothetical protein n=1 Tax=Streptomyces kanasensis TaxID=936756 RepID=UPI0036F561D5